jgi:hypothetical protein
MGLAMCLHSGVKGKAKAKLIAELYMYDTVSYR